MKFLTLSILLCISTIVFGENICTLPASVEGEYRMSETVFTKKRANAALNELMQIVEREDENYKWLSVPNSQRIVMGYLFKRKISTAQGSSKELAISSFCNFLKTEAYWSE